MLAQFIDYIKQRKTVPLEQLATEFKLRTTEVIDRVQGLEAMGRLTGVMDERGKVGGWKGYHGRASHMCMYHMCPSKPPAISAMVNLTNRLW